MRRGFASGPISTPGSMPSLTTTDSARRANPSRKRSKMLRCTKKRVGEVHT